MKYRILSLFILLTTVVVLFVYITSGRRGTYDEIHEPVDNNTDSSSKDNKDDDSSSKDNNNNKAANPYAGGMDPKYCKITTNADKMPHYQAPLEENDRRTAICLIGFPGAVNTTHAFLKHVLKPLKADLFVVSASPLPHALERHAVGIDRTSINQTDVVKWFDERNKGWRKSAKYDNYLAGLPAIKAHGHSAYQLNDRYRCFSLIQEAEAAIGEPDAYVGAGRLDLMWMAHHPTLKPHGCWVPCQTNDMGGFCDHWVFCDRNAAGIYLDGGLKHLPVKQGCNAETWLKRILGWAKVPISRGIARFFRSCANDPMPERCEFIEPLYMWGKPSGGQLEPFQDGSYLEYAQQSHSVHG